MQTVALVSDTGEKQISHINKLKPVFMIYRENGSKSGVVIYIHNPRILKGGTRVL